jgi:peptidoglycan/xylan/chitin deacetylase (PgdA/CDA1 family)
MANKCCVRAFAVFGLMISFGGMVYGQEGQTQITRWQYGKNGAVSLTYDDGSINQFRVAVPIMDTFGLPATFFIITGDIPGSRYHGTFIGRPTNAIVEETANTPTNKDSFLERASAIGFLGYPEAIEYHTRAGEVFDEGKDFDKAYHLIDEAYAKVRQGVFKPAAEHVDAVGHRERITWGELIALANRGYEFASHTVTHPRLAALDDVNLVYELEKSRQEILDHLGFKHTFSVECPYGTENPRAVQYALQRYQVARNHMPDPFVDDLDRWNTMDPADSKKEYVRWQRGALTKRR